MTHRIPRSQQRALLVEALARRGTAVRRYLRWAIAAPRARPAVAAIWTAVAIRELTQAGRLFETLEALAREDD